MRSNAPRYVACVLVLVFVHSAVNRLWAGPAASRTLHRRVLQQVQQENGPPQLPPASNGGLVGPAGPGVAFADPCLDPDGYDCVYEYEDYAVNMDGSGDKGLLAQVLLNQVRVCMDMRTWLKFLTVHLLHAWAFVHGRSATQCPCTLQC